MLIFQYGSNCNPARLNAAQRLGGQARPIGLAQTLSGWELEFTVDSAQNGCAAANLAPGRTHIWGVLYALPEQSLPLLDAIEGNYYRDGIRVQMRSGPAITVTTYLAHSPRSGLLTNASYAHHIFTGLQHFRAPAPYIAYVRSQATGNNPALQACW